ncbi:MAG: fused MFS/spermidine synthase [Phycisphaerae bacterium]|nr:fused MFS/spermidine synthase [Phycisphaerae bacterium]
MRHRHTLIHAMFVLSGFTGLVYEVVWARRLTLTLGASTFAVAAVLIAFMGGMSAGAFLFGRLADRRKRHLLIYGLLEIAIGIYALLFPTILEWVGGLYVLVYQHFEPGFYAISLIRLALSVAILLAPTIAMGGTLPVLCAMLAAERGCPSKRTAALYALNTLGGVAGCLCAGFLLIPHYGLPATTLTAAATNLAIGLVAILLQRRWIASPPETPLAGRGAAMAPAAPASPVIAAVVAATALCGFTAMVYQTIWTRVLSMVIGTTVYAFTTILAAFLTGIVLGSLIYSLRPPRRSVLWLGVAQILIAVWVALAMPRFDELPFVFLRVFDWTSSSWPLFQLVRFLMLLAVLLVPGTLFGICFPLAVGTVVRRVEEAGSKVGLIYSFNTIGAVLGAFAGGFVIVVYLGFQKGMVVTAGLNAFAGLGLLAIGAELTARRRAAVIAAAATALFLSVLGIRPWRIHHLNSGAYVYAHDYRDLHDVRQAMNAYRIAYYREGPTATVSVFHDPRGTMSLAIDGKTDASTGEHADMSTQILLSHLPVMFVDRPRDALLIGLGSGVSLGSLLQHRVERVDVVEISEAVVEASELFRRYNHDALDDPRVNLIVGDGRHHLQRTGRRYDVIISQPSNPWITGVSNLFTREYYQAMSRRLNRGGVVCQWIPSYHMSQEMLAVITKTFSAVFPCASMWSSSVVGDLFLIGSNEKVELDYRLFLERLGRPRIKQDLARIGMDEPLLLARTFKFAQDGIAQFLSRLPDHLPENSDDYPVVEFMTPRFLLTQRVARDFRRPSDLAGSLGGLLNLIAFTEEENSRNFADNAQQIMQGDQQN